MPRSEKRAKRNVAQPDIDSVQTAGTGNVFKDIGFSDFEASKKLLKCQLMVEIERIIKQNGWTQAEAAKQLGVVQPRISEIMTTRIERFTIDMLLRYLHRLGKEVRLTIIDFGVA